MADRTPGWLDEAMQRLTIIATKSYMVDRARKHNPRFSRHASISALTLDFVNFYFEG